MSVVSKMVLVILHSSISKLSAFSPFCPFIDGHIDGAVVCSPRGMAIDSTGCLYIADAYNYRLRKIQPQSSSSSRGNVKTIAGNATSRFISGNGVKASFNYPSDVCVDPTNNQIVYIADYDGIRRLNVMDGMVTSICGSGRDAFADGEGKAASFNQARGIAIDATGTYLYVADDGK
jgi:DNA-binding beta-propeller fold protein YncE